MFFCLFLFSFVLAIKNKHRREAQSYDPKTVRWRGIPLYLCQLKSKELIECKVLKAKIVFPVQLNQHCKHGQFDVKAKGEILTKVGDIFKLQIGKKHLSYQFNIGKWEKAKEIRYQGFLDLKEYLIE